MCLSHAHRYMFLVWCSFSQYARFIMRLTGFAICLPSAWLLWICNCRQNDSSELESSEWLWLELSCAYIGPAWGWCALGFLQLFLWCVWVFFWQHKHEKWSYLLHILYWYFFAGHWDPCAWIESAHLLQQSGILCIFSIVVRFLDLVCHLTFRSLVCFLLTSWSSLLIVSICGKLSSLVSHQVNLRCLWVSSYLFDVTCSGLWALKLFGQLPNSTGRELVQINTSFSESFRHKIFIT